MLQIRQNLKHNRLIRMKMMKLLIEKMKLSLKHQIQLRSRNSQAKKMKVKNRVNGGTCRSLLNDVKSSLLKTIKKNSIVFSLCYKI